MYFLLLLFTGRWSYISAGGRGWKVERLLPLWVKEIEVVNRAVYD